MVYERVVRFLEALNESEEKIPSGADLAPGGYVEEFNMVGVTIDGHWTPDQLAYAVDAITPQPDVTPIDNLHPLVSLLRRHELGAHYGSRHLGAGHALESQCKCGTWFPSFHHDHHLAEVLIEAGYHSSKESL